MNIKSILISKFKKINIEFEDKHLIMFENFLNLLKITNNKFNLTSIKEDNDIINKHFIDSIYIMSQISLNNKQILDFGTGAGFPGIPLSILNSKSNFVLLDSNNKKINFIKDVITSLSLHNCFTKCIRMENYYDIDYNYYDIIIVRAVSNLFIISELTIPFLKLGGIFIAMKSIHCDDEIFKAKNHIFKLGGKIINIHDYCIPDTDIVHRLIMIKKIKHTNKLYPRKYDEILRNYNFNLNI